jgi:hypothetical protein
MTGVRVCLMKVSRTDVACGIVIGLLVLGCVALAYPEWSEARFRREIASHSDEADRAIRKDDPMHAAACYSALLKTWNDRGQPRGHDVEKAVDVARHRIPLLLPLSREQQRKALGDLGVRLHVRFEAEVLQELGRAENVPVRP